MSAPPDVAAEAPSNRTPGRAALDQSRLNCLVGYANTRASIELVKGFKRHLGPLHLKAVEFSILVLVDSNEGANQRQLGESLDVSAPNMAITLDRMVQHGWVQRVRSTEDRRAQIIHLTPAGRELLERAEKVAHAMDRELTGMLSDGERLLLIELLLKVARGRRDAD